jgi:hypothetical protein
MLLSIQSLLGVLHTKDGDALEEKYFRAQPANDQRAESARGR